MQFIAAITVLAADCAQTQHQGTLIAPWATFGLFLSLIDIARESFLDSGPMLPVLDLSCGQLAPFLFFTPLSEPSVYCGYQARKCGGTRWFLVSVIQSHS